IWAARSSASYAAGTEAGWLSHFVNERMSPPWSDIVWIQSIHGRRRAASHGPVAPRISMGTRSHHALKIAMLACRRPTFEWRMAPIMRPLALAYPWAMATALSSWMHVSICGVLLPRSFTRLSWSPRKLAPGTSATYGTSSRCSIRAIASLPHTSVRAVDGFGISGTMDGTGLLGVIGSPPWATSGARVPPGEGEWQGSNLLRPKVPYRNFPKFAI